MDSNEFQEQSNHGFAVEFPNNVKGHLSPAHYDDYTIVVETDADFRLFSNNWVDVHVDVSEVPKMAKKNTNNHDINKRGDGSN